MAIGQPLSPAFIAAAAKDLFDAHAWLYANSGEDPADNDTPQHRTQLRRAEFAARKLQVAFEQVPIEAVTDGLPFERLPFDPWAYLLPVYSGNWHAFHPPIRSHLPEEWVVEQAREAVHRMELAALEPPRPSPVVGKTTTGKRRNRPTKLETNKRKAEAVLLAASHPELTDSEIAAKVNLDRKTLKTSEVFKWTRSENKASGMRVRRGSKTDGRIEAVDDAD